MLLFPLRSVKTRYDSAIKYELNDATNLYIVKKEGML